MLEQLNQLPKARVLVVGDVMLDRYWYGSTERVSPEAPVPVVNVSQHEERLGGAANVALNIASLKASSTLLGVIGQDDAGQSLINLLSDKQIHNALHFSQEKPTVTKLRVLSRDQQLIRLDFEQGFGQEEQQEVLKRFEQVLEDVDVVVLSDYAKGVLLKPTEFIQRARARHIPVLVDPKSKSFADYQGATLLTPNLKEFEAVVGHCKDEQAIVEKGMALLEAHDLEMLLVTRGKHGMTLLQKNTEPFHLPTQAREVYDVTGAGDTVIATLATAMAAGVPVLDAAKLANQAAGLVVGKLGTASIALSELIMANRGEELSSKGIIDETKLKVIRAHLKQANKKLVMTNGCFDILHQGHVTYLQQAKALGDYLIVAVNSDESVKRLKGDSRPINSLKERMHVLSALEAVDWVIPFAEDTPEALYAEFLPDLLVKGGDYQIEEIAGHKQVIANGGEVKTIDLVPGCATSNVVAKISEQVKHEVEVD